MDRQILFFLIWLVCLADLQAFGTDLLLGRGLQFCNAKPRPPRFFDKFGACKRHVLRLPLKYLTTWKLL